MVWNNLTDPVKVGKFAFSSQMDGHLEQSPTDFELVGSNKNCNERAGKIQWTSILKVQTQFTELNQSKFWDVPRTNRQIFRCMGIKVNKANYGNATAIQGIRMWTEENFNECLQNTHNCDTHATCTFTQGTFTCSCNAGFIGDGTAGNCIGKSTPASATAAFE